MRDAFPPATKTPRHTRTLLAETKLCSFNTPTSSHPGARGDGAEASEAMSDGGGGTGHTAGYEPVRGAEDTGARPG